MMSKTLGCLPNELSGPSKRTRRPRTAFEQNKALGLWGLAPRDFLSQTGLCNLGIFLLEVIIHGWLVSRLLGSGNLVEKDCLNVPIIWEQSEFHKNFFSICVTILKMI